MQKFHIQAYDESFPSLDLDARIVQKLEQLKGSAILTLSDLALGDRGCELISRYFKDNSHEHISRLDLKANNIGEKGIAFIA